MDEYIFENVAPQRRNIDYPWLMSAGRKWLDDTWLNTLEDWERIKAATAEAGANLMQTEEEREARLLAEAQAAALEKEKQFGIDKAISDENLAMEGIYSQAGTRGVEEPYRVAAARGAKDLRDDKKEMDEWEQAFLLSMMENMRGEDIGQAPAVVAGGGQRQWPSMMGQFAPWEQQKPYWWIA